MEDNNIMSDMGFELKDIPQTGNTETADEITCNAEVSNGAENTLKIIALITLVCGIILTLILLATICWIDNPAYHYHQEKMFNPSGFGITCGVLMSSLISWAALNVFANISLTLKQINSKLKD